VNGAELRKLLSHLDACSEAVFWTGGKTPAEAWGSCERADWMLRLCGRMAGADGWRGRTFCSWRASARSARRKLSKPNTRLTIGRAKRSRPRAPGHKRRR